MNDVLEAPAEVERPKLTMHDVCDSPGVKHQTAPKHRQEHPDCGATSRAYVLVQLPSGFDLRFCKHHYEGYEVALMAQGAVVLDDTRETLEVKPGVSAAS